MITDIKKALFFDKNNYLEILLDKNTKINYADLCAKYLKDGFKIVNLSNLNFSDNDYLKTALEVRNLCSIFNSLLFISNRLDIAKICNADGLVLDYGSIPYRYIGKILDDTIVIGCKNPKTTDSFDFILSDEIKYDTKSPVYRKTKVQNNVIIYEKGNYGNN